MTPQEFGRLSPWEADSFVDTAYRLAYEGETAEVKQLAEQDLRTVSQYFMGITGAVKQ